MAVLLRKSSIYFANGYNFILTGALQKLIIHDRFSFWLFGNEVSIFELNKIALELHN